MAFLAVLWGCPSLCRVLGVPLGEPRSRKKCTWEEGGPMSSGGQSVRLHTPRPPNVTLLRALWSLLDGIWGLSKGSWGVLVLIPISFCGMFNTVAIRNTGP